MMPAASVHGPWALPVVQTPPAAPKAKAMPGLVVNSVSISLAVIDEMLRQEEAKPGTTISQLAQRCESLEVKQEAAEPVSKEEAETALSIATTRLSAARQAMRLAHPPLTSTASATAIAPCVPHPVYETSHGSSEVVAAWNMPTEEVKEQEVRTCSAHLVGARLGDSEPAWT